MKQSDRFFEGSKGRTYTTMAGHHSFFGLGGGHEAPPPVSQHPGAPPGQHQGHSGAPPTRQGPAGELVTVVAEQNKNYRLTSKDDGVSLVYKNQQDPKQFWIKIDYGDKFIDEEGARAFILVNKATGYALSHGLEIGAAVTQEPYIPHAIDNSVLWSQSKDLGNKFTAIRVVTNIHLNLDADHGDKKHGGIKEGNRLVVHVWNKQENQKWLIAPVGPED